MGHSYDKHLIHRGEIRINTVYICTVCGDRVEVIPGAECKPTEGVSDERVHGDPDPCD